jgi:hypothetical protein
MSQQEHALGDATALIFRVIGVFFGFACGIAAAIGVVEGLPGWWQWLGASLLIATVLFADIVFEDTGEPAP